jgi:hypothetical protein
MVRVDSSLQAAMSRSDQVARRVAQEEMERRWREGLVIFHVLTTAEMRILIAQGAVKDRRRRVWLLPAAEPALKLGFIHVRRGGRGIYARKPRVNPCPDCARHLASGRWKVFDGEGAYETCLRCGALVQLAIQPK